MNLISQITKSPYIKNVAVLASGSALSRAVPILISPILTRLYTPEDFGMFAVFMALVTSVLPVVCGRYEIAMVLPKDERDGQDLLGICFLVSTAISVCCLLLVSLFKGQLFNLLGAQVLNNWIYLVPLVIWLGGIMTAMNYYLNRNKNYGGIAKAQLINSLGAGVVGVSCGVIASGFWGLLVGNITGISVSTIYLIWMNRHYLSKSLIFWNNNKTRLFRHFSDYPLYNASTGLLNGLTLAMPIFFLNRYYSAEVVGCYSLLMRVANTPLSLISGSVSQVNLRKVVDLVNDGQSVLPYLLKVTLGLSGIVIGPTIILMIFAPMLFSFVFGEGWYNAGLYMQILLPSIAVRFIVSTLSTTLGATRNNLLGAVWKIFSFIATLLVFYIYAPQGEPMTLFRAVVIIDVLLYLIYYLTILMAASRPRNELMQR